MYKIKHFIPFAPPLIGREEINEVVDTLKSGWITTGPKTKEFEARFARYVEAKYAIAVNSCTAALHLSLNALGIKERDEVITSPFTFASTAHTILYQRARPVFVDIDMQTFNIDYRKIEEKITSRTKAIIPVHYGGCPCAMDEIMRIAKKHKLKVGEDAAHAVGAEYKGRKIGSIGDITCFSFYATKNLTTAEGGMVTTNKKVLTDKIRIMSMYGISDARQIWKRYSPSGSWHYDIRYLGFKYNMTDIQASLGIYQLKKLDRFIKIRESYARIYDAAFKDCQELIIPSFLKGLRHARHLYPILLKTELLKIGRLEFVEKLRRRNIGASVLFQPLHLHTFYKTMFQYKRNDFPNAEFVYKRIICIPISPKITKDKIYYIAEQIKAIIKKYRR